MATAAPLLKVSFRTTPVGAAFAPANCVAAWIENADGVFIKTIGRWCELRKDHLVAWENKAGLLDIDAVSGATRPDHGPTLSVEWDVKDKLGELVPDGIYTIRLETADGNSTAQAQNNQGTFTFTKGLVPDVQTALTGGGYEDVSIDFNPAAGECNNNILDPGETCDPPGSCPVTCEQSVDACAPNVLVGSSAACTAACTVVPISACLNGDGCCAAGCTAAEDDDCVSNEVVDGGCATGGDGHGGLLAFSLLGAIALFSRRRR